MLWGIRFDDKEYKVGDELPKSRRWDECGVTGELLNGTSVLFVSDERDFLEYLDGILDADCGELDRYNWAMEQQYQGKYIYLVYIENQWGWEHGEDEGEMVMNGPEVARIIKCPIPRQESIRKSMDETEEVKIVQRPIL